jgi:hypothetical protein
MLIQISAEFCEQLWLSGSVPAFITNLFFYILKKYNFGLFLIIIWYE